MTNYCGYMGKVVLLDLSTGKAENYIWTDLDREKYIGGKAMASKILYDSLTGKETPFSPENLIVIATGPLTGTGAPSSNRFDISSLSPLTGITSSSNCGGNFGHYLKKAGFDALIIRGKCERPTWVEIDNGEFRFHDAASLWGMKAGETQEALQKELLAEHGKPVRCGMAVIGPAGENLVRYASVISGERAAGRAGMGAVFGSKNLKAITSAGDAVPSVFDKDKALEHHKRWVSYIRSHPLTGEQLPRLGTAGLVSSMQVHGLLSTRNYAKGRFEDFEAVSGEALAEELNVSNSGCLSCPIRCTRRVPVEGKTVKGPELETLGLLGGNIENRDLELLCRWNYELDELGMDTISTAGTLAWAMEANEKGLWKNGLSFGEVDGLSQVFDDIAHRRGIGAELAEGSKRLSEKYGGKEFAIHSKGMELAAYEPRRAVGQGLGYAVANRGGCHLNGGYLVVLEGLGMNVNGQTPRGKADLCMIMQDLMEAISMGGQCLFTSYGVVPAFMIRNPNGLLAKTVNAVVPWIGPAVRVLNKAPEIACFQLFLLPYTYELNYTVGMKMNIGKFIRAGERSYNVERAVNARFGVSAENDKLPKRLTDMPQDPKRPDTKVPLEQMNMTYYRARGWEKNGLPSEKKLRRLGIR
ncbi:MAG: aldehyde ferredoxin oxidoreductase family protein [Oscillospiraceae bacterium]|nr:aldehyde ferredoxin oxidoreductase family protein [Oscillospiraceae bacterium]